jgi:hypothetical protein
MGQQKNNFHGNWTGGTRGKEEISGDCSPSGRLPETDLLEQDPGASHHASANLSNLLDKKIRTVPGWSPARQFRLTCGLGAGLRSMRGLVPELMEFAAFGRLSLATVFCNELVDQIATFSRIDPALGHFLGLQFTDIERLSITIEVQEYTPFAVWLFCDLNLFARFQIHF